MLTQKTNLTLCRSKSSQTSPHKCIQRIAIKNKSRSTEYSVHFSEAFSATVPRENKNAVKRGQALQKSPLKGSNEKRTQRPTMPQRPLHTSLIILSNWLSDQSRGPYLLFSKHTRMRNLPSVLFVILNEQVYYFIWTRSTERINNAERLASRTATTMARNSETFWHNVHSPAMVKQHFLLNLQSTQT